MIKNKVLDKLEEMKYNSSILKNLKEFFTDLINQNFSRTLNVKVDNLNTKLEIETASNTRGLKGKLDKLIEKTVDLSQIENKLDRLIEKEVKIDSVNVGKVSVDNFPEPVREIKVSNLSELVQPRPKVEVKVDNSSLDKAINDLKSSFSQVYEYLPQLKAKEFPKITIPRQVSVKESEDIINSVKEMTKTISDDLFALSEVIKNQETGMSTNSRGEIEVKVSNFPPQHIPTPVTNISINSLRGVPKSTVVQVGTSATPLPATALEQRRSMIVFNNSGNTIYLGGANVTISTGLPVLDQNYSPPIDAGDKMIVYAIAGSNNNEVRVFEVSSDGEGN